MRASPTVTDNGRLTIRLPIDVNLDFLRGLPDQRNANGETALVLAKRIHENKQIGNAELVQSRVVDMLLKAGAR